MEHINCILCKMDDTHLLVKKDSFNVVRCNRCGLVYLNPRLNETELAELYNASSNSTVTGQLDTGHDAHKIKKFNLAIYLLKKHKKDIQNIFDLGCSTGIFLELVAKEGWTPFGSDVNSNLVEENQRSYGDQVKLQVGDRIDFSDQYFDVVTLFDSIEHISDPIGTLKDIARVLRDDGLIVISTPNVDGLFPRLTHALLGKTIGAWEHPTPPGHVFQFSPKTLRKTLEMAGFEWVDCKNFEIYMPYTVGELENSIINVLRKNVQNTKKVGQKAWLTEKNKRKGLRENGVEKLPRLLVRWFCWVLVVTVYPVGRLFGWGDSMIVVARKVKSKG